MEGGRASDTERCLADDFHDPELNIELGIECRNKELENLKGTKVGVGRCLSCLELEALPRIGLSVNLLNLTLLAGFSLTSKWPNYQDVQICWCHRR